MEALKFSNIGLLRRDTKIKELSISKIRPNPYQPRKYLNRNALEELAASILEYGVLQPILVRKMGGSNFELVAGERRLQAAEIAGLTSIPCIIVSVNDNDSIFMAWIENLQRETLHFLEEGEGYASIMEDYGLTQEELAGKLNKSQSCIANKLRLLKLSDEAKRLVVEYKLSERHARAVLKLPDEKSQIEAIRFIVQEDLTVKRTEDMVLMLMERIRCGQSLEKGEQREKRLVNDLRLFTNSITQSVDIIKKSGMDVEYEKSQSGDFCDIHIKVAGNIWEN